MLVERSYNPSPKMAREETQVAQFRARPWPVVRGSERDLDAKRKAVRGYGPRPDIDHSDFANLLMRVEREVDLQWLRTNSLLIKQGHGPLIGPVPLAFDLFAQESWRAQVCHECHLPVDANQLMDAEADAAFAELKARWCDDGTVGRDLCYGVRELIKWLMNADLDCLTFLIRQGILHVGEDLFPPCTQEWKEDGDVGEAESLLSLAAKDACSPAAVRLLLDHGADPNGELVPRSFNGGYLPTCGPGALACLDVRGEWPAFPADKLAILTALASAGGETLEACEEYRNATGHEAARAVCNQLFQEELERASRDARQRLETVVALVGIVSFWRRVAAAPDSKAAKAAIARAAKRARAWT